MDQLIIIAVNTLIIPFVVAGIKKLFRTDKLSEQSRKTLHTILPLAAGILSSGLVEFQKSGNWKLALAVGLGSGGAASSLRDADKYLNVTGTVRDMFQDKDGSTPGNQS